MSTNPPPSTFLPMSMPFHDKCPIHPIGRPPTTNKSLPAEFAICVIITNPDNPNQVALVRSVDGSIYRLPRKNMRQNYGQIDWTIAVQCALSETGNAVKIIKKDPVLATLEWIGDSHWFTYCFEAEASAATPSESAVTTCGNVMIWVDLAQMGQECNKNGNSGTKSIDASDKARLQCLVKDRRRFRRA
ncbi:hypothetical protein MBLNU457_1386t1 [Dothideomycetes sp. NU457]